MAIQWLVAGTEVAEEKEEADGFEMCFEYVELVMSWIGGEAGEIEDVSQVFGV